MNIFLKSFSHQELASDDAETEYIQQAPAEEDLQIKYFHHPPQILAVLLSATCVGNDGRSCPLFHGSLAPMIFGKTSDEKLRRLLLKSNNITWIQSFLWCNYFTRSSTLQSSR